MTKLNEFLEEVSSSKDGGPLRGALLGRIGFKKIGPFPLARMIDLGDTGVPTTFPTGELRIELSDVAATPVEILIAKVAKNGDDAATITIELAPMSLGGHYRLFALEQPKVELDTGGGLMPLAAISAPADQPTITPQQFEQLKQARLQREQLKTTANGQTLLRSYSTHNDAFNNAFQTNSALRANWQAQGATQAMADDTSAAIANGTVVNSSTATYGLNKIGYNDNAFQQQTYLVSALLWTNPDAASAASTFANQVTTATGNTQIATTEMTANGVYDAVNSCPPTMGLQTSDANPLRFHDSLALVARNEHGDDDLQLLKKHGYKMDDSQVRAMQEIYAESVRQADPVSQAELWNGEISASVPASRFEFTLTQHDGGVIATNMTRHNMAVPDLQIDKSAWRGGAGTIARKRLESAHFVRSLLAARIIDFIDRAVIAVASRFASENPSA